MVYLDPIGSRKGYYCYMVLDLLGPDLCSAFSEPCTLDGRHWRLTPRLFIELGKSMLKTLRHVHEHGLIHRYEGI